MLLFKHGRNRAAAFGMLWELLMLALIHQVAGESPPESPAPVAPPSAANTVGFGRHTKSGEKVKLSSDNWNPAASPEDLKAYKDAGALNPCDDIEYDKETGDIIVKYRKDGRTRSVGCMVDLLTKYTTSVDFIIGIKNGNGLEHCLKPTVTLSINCWGFFSKTCDHPIEYLYYSDTNTLPFIYSRTVAEFQSMRKFEPATGDGCPGSCWGNVVCRKWTGLAAGFANNGGNVARTVVGIGNPGGSGCTLATGTAVNDASYKMTVDNGNMHWFTTEGCAGKVEGGFPRDAQCVNKNSMAQELGEKITWEIEGNRPDSDFTQLFTFALLPQAATRVHNWQQNSLSDGSLMDRNVTRSTSNFSFKLLVPKSGAPTIIETLAPPPELVSETPPPALAPTEDGGGGGMVVVVIIVIVLIVAVVGGVLVFFFVIKKSEPDAVEEDYFGTSKAGGTTKTKAGTTVGATQAKTGGLTTVGTKAGTTAGGTAKTAAAATKAGTTVGGKTAGGKTAGGGTTKK
uniref:Uncharacterized protein n=1 Tax=Meloidogyne enterolobii TaxID=390850 RepID=A0A6V7TQX7_MELEN|nr:unnamed protein product [Meloidogyne enterolobii]